MGGSEGATALLPEDEINTNSNAQESHEDATTIAGATPISNVPVESLRSPCSEDVHRGTIAPPEQSERSQVTEIRKLDDDSSIPTIDDGAAEDDGKRACEAASSSTSAATIEASSQMVQTGDETKEKEKEKEKSDSATKNEAKGKEREPTNAARGPRVAECHAKKDAAAAEKPATTESSEEPGSASLNPMFVLAHFCELHGPSVLLCTQLIRSTAPSSAPSSPVSSSSSSASSSSSSSTNEQEQDVNSGGSSAPNSAAQTASGGDSSPAASRRSTSPPGSGRWAFPLSAPAGASFTLSSSNSPILKVDAASSSILPTDSIKSSAASSLSGRRSAPVCPSCNALPSDSGFFSVDDDNGTYFITTRYPSATYARIRTASVRALSCEFSPGREGPMFFGDEENGFCLSYVFKVHDLQARGFVRWYGVLFLAPQASLLASTDFLVGSVKGVVHDLQEQSAVIFDREREEKERLQAQSAQAPLGTSPSTGGGISGALRSRTNFPTGPGAFRRRQIHANAPLRGLDALIKDKNLPGKLHSSFTWILQQWERQHLASPFKPFSGPTATSSSTPVVGDAITASSVGAGPSSSPVFSFISAVVLPDHSELDQLKEAASEHVLAFETLQQLMHALGSGKFNALLYNVLCGNQVIVRGECRPLVASVLALLTDLVPERCAKVKSWEPEQYHESWEFNFLGVSRDVAVPDYIPPGSYALVDILPHRSLASTSTATPPHTQPTRVRTHHSSFNSDTASATRSEPALLTPTRGAAAAVTAYAPLLSPTAAALAGFSTSPSPMAASPLAPTSPCGVNAWTSYRYDCHAKVEGAIGTLPAEVVGVLGLHLPRHFEIQRLQAIKHAWSSKAKAFFTVSKMVESEKDVRLQTFLNATSLLEADLPVLRYWTTGLRHNCALLRLIATQPTAARPATVSVPFTPTRSATFMGSALLSQGSSSFSRTSSIYTTT